MQEELLLEILNVVKRSETENKKAIKELKNDLKEFKEETRTAINGLEEKVDKLETKFDVFARYRFVPIPAVAVIPVVS